MNNKRTTRRTMASDGAYRPPSYGFRVRRTLRPGARGTQRHVNEYHESLYCVRYRDDEEHGLRYTTIELIRSVRPLARRAGPFKLEEIVAIWPTRDETGLQQKLQKWGGTWDAQRGCWLVKYKVARKMRLASRAKPAPATPST